MEKIALLFIGLLCATCVRVDEEFENLGNQHIGEGNWTQITNLRMNNLIRYNLETGVIFNINKEGNNFIKYDEYREKYKDVSWDFEFVFDFKHLLILNTNRPYTLLPMNFDEVYEAPNPDDFLYKNNIHHEGFVSDWKNISGEFSIDNAALNNIGFCSFEAVYVEKKGYVSLHPTTANRTFIFKTSKGYWAKLQIQSFYKDAPIKPTIDSGNPNFLTFRYFVQKDGSRNLTTKKQ